MLAAVHLFSVSSRPTLTTLGVGQHNGGKGKDGGGGELHFESRWCLLDWTRRAETLGNKEMMSAGDEQDGTEEVGSW